MEKVSPGVQTRLPMATMVAAEQDRIRSMPTAALLRQAISEVKLLAKAEVLHAKQELREELQAARVAFVLLGVCLGIGLCGLSVLFVAIGLALPLSEVAATLTMAGLLIVTAAACGAIGYRRLPKKPLQSTQRRLKEDLSTVRERFA
jgi:uncharacterized membrane protein YqjE